MNTAIVYVDRSDIKAGMASELRRAVTELVAFVEAREPQLISYSFHIDNEAATMTVVAVHPDAASLELHMNIGGPEFRKVGEFIKLRLIEVFGDPGETAIRQLHEKAKVLGGADVIVRSVDAGFARVSGTESKPRSPGPGS